MTRSVETEIKLRVKDRASMLEKLSNTGLRISAERQFESNTIYDTKDHALRRAGSLLRLRQMGEKCKVTWKGPGEPGRYKSRPELETAAASCEVLHKIFVQLGFEPSFRYEKFRTEFAAKEDSAVVTFDETPIGDFLELEGSGEWIDRMAAKLGFSESDYILDSYAQLYASDCERRGVQPEDMVFASHPG